MARDTRAARLYRRVPSHLRGILAIILATVVMTGMQAVIRSLSGELHPFEIAFFRCLFGVVVLIPMVVRLGLPAFRTRQPRLVIARGVLNSGAMLAFFMALGLAPLATVTALGFSAPLFATIGAVLILGERIRARRIAALVAGFVGVLTIVRPFEMSLDTGTLLAISGSALWGACLIIIKIMSRTESSLSITLYMGLVMTPLVGVAAAFVWVWPGPGDLALLFLIGTLGTIGQWLMAQSFREAEASAVLPFDFLRLLWAGAFGYVLFGEIPDLWTWIGGTIIFGAATYVVLREAQVSGRPGPPPSQGT